MIYVLIGSPDTPTVGRARVVRHPVRAAPPHAPLSFFRSRSVSLLGGDVRFFPL